jgi:hypothetical protein
MAKALSDARVAGLAAEMEAHKPFAASSLRAY